MIAPGDCRCPSGLLTLNAGFDSKIELAGFGWNQGWNDGCDPAMVAEYEKNMANLIRDVRKDLNAPKLPFVISDTGMLGNNTKGDMAALCEIEMGFGDAKKHPEFAGTAASVNTRGFARPVEQSPSASDYHWNHNGESHYLIGAAVYETGSGASRFQSRLAAAAVQGL